MLLLFSEYLSPTNQIASGIVTILQSLFLGWCIGLIAHWFWLINKKRQISKNEDVQPLINARQEQAPELEDGEEKKRPESAFSEFCRSRSLPEHTEVAKHLGAIFLAGWNESRLEVGELVNHTTSNLLKLNGLLRAVLAMFIIIGLLGTLFGLTDSLTQLSPALEAGATDETSAENNKKMTQALSLLLDQMKSAFAPSIWGIGFTIVGVIFYNVYLSIVCQPVKSILERLTLTVWIPQLYPITSQRLIQTLQQSEQQMRSGYQTATRVGELVETVQSNISNFNQNLNRANDITQPLSDSVSQINGAANVLNKTFVPKLNEFSQEFAANVTDLTGFQVEIRNLYQQLQDESETFQQGANQKLDEQTQNLVETLNALKNYEETYIASCQQIDKTLQEFLNKATETNTSIKTTNREFLEDINAANREWIEKIQNQLTADLAVLQPTLETELRTLTNGLTVNLRGVQGVLDEQLETLNNRLNNFDAPLNEAIDQMRGTLDNQLETLNDRLNSFDIPLKEAADQMRGTFQNLVSYMQRIVGDLQEEIKKQNENYGDQLKAVNRLNQQIVELLDRLDQKSENQMNQLAQHSERQGAAVSTLGSAVGNLREDTNNLTAAIKSFTSDSGSLNESIGAIEQHVETLGTASQQLIEKTDVTALTVDIGKLRESIGEIAQYSQALAASAGRGTIQTSLSSQSNSNLTKERKVPFLKRIWTRFLGNPSSTQPPPESANQRENEGGSTRSDT